MADIFWPEELPSTFLMEGLSAKTNSLVIRTQMDAGPKKARRRYTASTKTFTGQMLLDSEQRFILERFYKTHLADGVLRFNFKNPYTLATEEFRFTEDYTETAQDGYFRVQLSLERLS